MKIRIFRIIGLIFLIVLVIFAGLLINLFIRTSSLARFKQNKVVTEFSLNPKGVNELPLVPRIKYSFDDRCTFSLDG
ncbi:MAG: hypothetical protein M1514_00030, partial [Patescibacteria group bacterium]|nr:hypothetical protein [Patescibacteria group bacterium]